jgi:hypothetical protein
MLRALSVVPSIGLKNHNWRRATRLAWREVAS